MASIKDDFIAFIKQGNLIQLAVAFVMGAAFSALVTSLVANVFTPLIGVIGHLDFAGWTFTLNGSTIMQGLFLNSLITFITITLVVFFIIALPYQRWVDRQNAKKAAVAPTTRACPECLSQIPLAAKRCSFCTSTVAPTPLAAAAAPAA